MARMTFQTVEAQLLREAAEWALLESAATTAGHMVVLAGFGSIMSMAVQ